MPKVLPFRAWKYNSKKVKLEDVVAPPYDVVTEEEVKEFKEKSPYNIFHLEIPETYESAKIHLESWIKSEILIKDDTPKIYLYELEFSYNGKRYRRKGFVNLVELVPFEKGEVVPHERVFQKVTEDRFSLLKTTGFQFSQIFGLFEDEGCNLLNAAEELKSPVFSIEFNGEIHSLYEVRDVDFFRTFCEFFKEKKVFIADGHHRYTTALNYKAYMESLYGKSEDADYNFTSMYLCAFEDPNLLMLPTHRIYELERANEFLDKMKSLCELVKVLEKHEVPKSEFKVLEAEWIVVINEKGYLFRLKPEVLEALKQNDHILSQITLFNFLRVLEEVVGVKEEDLKAQNRVKFLSDVSRVLEECQGSKIGVVFPVLSPEVLKRVAEAGKRMPHKSTYFFPKILTGVLLNELRGNKVEFRP